MLKVGLNRHFQTCLTVLVFLLLSAATKAQPIVTSSPGPATYGTPYAYIIETVGITPVEYSLETSIPAWMSFDDQTGEFTGTPTEVGVVPTITVKITDPLLPLLPTYHDIDITIGKAELTATANNQTRIFGHADPTFTITYSGFKFSEGPGVIDTPPVAEPDADNTSGVGNYDINVNIGSALDDHYTFVAVKGTLEITRALLTITAQDKTRPYGDSNPPLTIIYSGFQNDDDNSDLTNQPDISVGTVDEHTGVGGHEITVENATADNYTITHVNGTLTITKAPLTAVAQNQSRPYRSAEPTFTIAYIGIKNSEDPSVVINDPPDATTDALVSSNAGTYSIFLANGSADNYDFTAYTTGTLTVTKIALTAKADDQSRNYGGNNPTFTITYTGFVNGETAAVLGPLNLPTASSTAGPTAAVGTHTIDVDITGALDENYTFIPAPGVLTINKATLTATANPQTRPYKSADPAEFTISYSGFVNGQTIADIPVLNRPTASPNSTFTSNAGNYIITPSGGSDPRYDFSYVTGAYTITKVTLTASANNTSKNYGDANPAFTISYSGFVPGETTADLDPLNLPEATSLATPATHVGSVSISVSGGVHVNYHFAYVPGTLTINKATLTATADSYSRPYGATNPAFTVSYSGFVNGDLIGVLDPSRPTAALVSPLTAVNVGAHTIGVSGGLDDDYTFNYVPGTLTITKINLTATANAQSRPYGSANLPLTFTYTGLISGDNAGMIDFPPGISTIADEDSPIGPYAIELDNNGNNATDNNYNLVLVNNVLTVTRASLTITANNQTKTYGDPNPTPLTTVFTGLVNDETPSTVGLFTTPLVVTTTATTTSGAGTYQITPKDAVAANYTITFVNGTLTVTKALLTATADDKTRPYGGTIPGGFTVTYSGFRGSDTPAIITDGADMSVVNLGPGLGVGNHTINIGTASHPNYDFAYVPGTLTITKALLTAKPDNKSRLYGDPEPLPFTVAYTGFVNGEGVGVIGALAQVTLQNGVDSHSTVGTYAINASNASDDNYDFTYVPGVLTINKAPLTLTANPQSRPYGAATNPTLTITYSGFKNGGNSNSACHTRASPYGYDAGRTSIASRSVHHQHQCVSTRRQLCLYDCYGYAHRYESNVDRNGE